MNMDSFEITFEPGSKFLLNGQLYKFHSAIDLDTVLLRDVKTGKSCTAKIHELKLPESDSLEQNHFSISKIDLSSISEKEWEKAKQREMVIKKLASISCTRDDAERAGKQLGISARQIYKLINKYRRSGYRLTGLLVPKKSGGKGKTRLSQDIEAIIQSVIQDIYLSKQQHKISKVIEEIQRRCFYANIKSPCENAVRKRIKEISNKEETLRRHGKDEARIFQPIIGSFPTPAHPMAILQIDHTPVDIIIVDEVHRKSIGRPYLTVAIDTYSRCITGFCLSLEAPSAVSVGLCLTHSTFDKELWLSKRNIKSLWPIWGKPQIIYVDNAKEFHCEALQRGCDAHGIKIDYRPIGQPHYGGIVERVIGTLMQLVHQLPGTTFSNIFDRGDYNSEKKAILTMAELECWLAIAITEYYHQKIHTGISMPPIEKYRIGILGDENNKGCGYLPKIYNKKSFLIDFLPIERRTLQRHGFMLDHITYYSTSLSPMIANRKKYGSFLIRRDPRDISRIYVFDADSETYLEIPYRTLSRPTITLWEHRQALQFLREKGIEKKDENLIFQAVEKMREIIKEATSNSKLARRRQERIMYAQSAIQPSGTTDNKNDELPIETLLVAPFEDIEIW